MIIDYKINSKHLPTERQVWLMSKEMEKNGEKPTMQVLKAMEKGELKYVNGVMYKLCRDCLEYLPLTDFYPNQRYVLDVGYICKKCTARRRRIKKYGSVSFISEVGMDETLTDDFTISVTEESKEKITRRL